MKIKLNVKDKSAHAFLEEMLLGYKAEERNGMGNYSDSSAYHLLRDEMYFKKDRGIKVGEVLKIELRDIAHMSRKELTSIYFYKAEQYDDVSIKMVLTHFTIEHTK